MTRQKGTCMKSKRRKTKTVDCTADSKMPAAGCERPSQPAPSSVPAVRPPALYGSAPLHPIFVPPSPFFCALLTFSAEYSSSEKLFSHSPTCTDFVTLFLQFVILCSYCLCFSVANAKLFFCIFVVIN